MWGEGGRGGRRVFFTKVEYERILFSLGGKVVVLPPLRSPDLCLAGYEIVRE